MHALLAIAVLLFILIARERSVVLSLGFLGFALVLWPGFFIALALSGLLFGRR